MCEVTSCSPSSQAVSIVNFLTYSNRYVVTVLTYNSLISNNMTLFYTHLFTSYIRTNSKWITVQHKKCKTIKLLEKYIGGKSL